MIEQVKWDSRFAEDPRHGELAQREHLRKALSLTPRRRTAVDAGAHIGLCSIFLAQHFDEVAAFEPVKENFDCLEANVPSNVRAYRAALGRCEEMLGLVRHGENSGCWRLDTVGGPGSFTHVFPLDFFLLTDVDLIKIDTEGTECEVIRGARATIARSQPVIVFEDNGLGQKFYGPTWVDPKQLLLELGYCRRFRIRKDEIWAPA